MVSSRPGCSDEDEPGVEAIGSCVHKLRALRVNTRLSSGTSAGTFACPAGPSSYRNCRGQTRTKNEPKWYLVPVQKKGPKVDPLVSNLKSCDFFFEGFRSTLKFIASGALIHSNSGDHVSEHLRPCIHHRFCRHQGTFGGK